MAQEIFRRYEKKYIVTLEQYQELISRGITQLCPDQYGKHTICSVYLDTEDYALIRQSLEKPVYKEKIRVRSYGTPGEEDTVFLELKKKYDGVVYKRRVEMSLKEARKYLYDGVRPKPQGQIFQEIDYACRYHQAYPRVLVAYERIAFSGRENPELRVTFDMNIRARDYRAVLGQDTAGVQLLEKNCLLMEVKIPGAMPVWMSRLFSELGIYPTSYSKYGTFYKSCIVPQGVFETGREMEGGGVCCA